MFPFVMTCLSTFVLVLVVRRNKRRDQQRKQFIAALDAQRHELLRQLQAEAEAKQLARVEQLQLEVMPLAELSQLLRKEWAENLIAQADAVANCHSDPRERARIRNAMLMGLDNEIVETMVGGLERSLMIEALATIRRPQDNHLRTELFWKVMGQRFTAALPIFERKSKR